MNLSIPVRGSLINRTHPLARNLVLCHAFNEGGGEFLFDASGRGNHGSTWGYDSVPPVWTAIASVSESGDGHIPTQIGGCLKFTESENQYIQTAQAGFWNTSLPHTYALWVNCDYGARYIAMPTTKANGVLTWTSTNKFRWTIAGVDHDIDTTLSPDIWYMLVCSYGSDGKVRMYVNGVLDITPVSRSPGNSDSDYWMWGTTSYSDSPHAYGLGYIWQRQLSQTEITTLYRDPWTMFPRPRIMTKRQLKFARVPKC